MNPFHSKRVQRDCLLEASRPLDLPFGEGISDRSMDSSVGTGNPLQNHSMGPTGKGRGGMSTGLFDEQRSTALGSEMRTEGKMPVEPIGRQTMGHVKPQTLDEGDENPDGLQRALEGELVNFLRQQNSKLLDEVANLRGLLEKSTAQVDSGVGSSPWSAVGGTPNGDSTGSASHGIPGLKLENPAQVRPGRHGSRTPRARVREAAVSPEKHGGRSLKFTPNGTRVPEGPPPDQSEHDELPRPPVPPFPMAVETGLVGDGQDGTFLSELYDTCESKAKVKNGDKVWKPTPEKLNDGGVLFT